MHYIDKSDNEPQAVIEWKEHHAEELQRMYDDETVSGDRIFSYIDEHRAIYDKDQLRQHLLKEQGHICCYCGIELSGGKGKTVIEHLSPKSVFKNSTYTYTNLLLSCLGGKKYKFHKVKEEKH